MEKKDGWIAHLDFSVESAHPRRKQPGERSFHNPALDAEADDLLAQFAYHFQLQKSLVAELSKALEHRSNSKDDLEVCESQLAGYR